MPTIPNCYFVEFEKLGVIGAGEAPAHLGLVAYQIAMMQAQADAAMKYPAHAAEKAAHIRQEYECTDPGCPDVFVEVEASPKFKWRERFLGRQGDRIVAIYILEIEFLIFCVDLPDVPEDEEFDEPKPVHEGDEWEQQSPPRKRPLYGMFERGKDGEIVWRSSKLPRAFRRKQNCS